VIKFKRNKLLSAYTSCRIDDVRRATIREFTLPQNPIAFSKLMKWILRSGKRRFYGHGGRSWTNTNTRGNARDNAQKSNDR